MAQVIAALRGDLLDMRALHEIERHRPQAHLAGDSILWTAPDGTPLGITPVAPRGRTGLWDAMVRATVPATADARAEAFAASLGTPTTPVVDLEDELLDLDEELAALSFLSRLPA